jgi:hypothetical protein
MAQPTNTFDTYDSVGEREDLSDVIYSISPTDTPFISSAAKTKLLQFFTNGKQTL